MLRPFGVQIARIEELAPPVAKPTYRWQVLGGRAAILFEENFIHGLYHYGYLHEG